MKIFFYLLGLFSINIFIFRQAFHFIRVGELLSYSEAGQIYRLALVGLIFITIGLFLSLLTFAIKKYERQKDKRLKK